MLGLLFFVLAGFLVFVLIIVELSEWLKLQIFWLIKISEFAVFMQKLPHRIKWLDLDLL